MTRGQFNRKKSGSGEYGGSKKARRTNQRYGNTCKYQYIRTHISLTFFVYTYHGTVFNTVKPL